MRMLLVLVLGVAGCDFFVGRTLAPAPCVTHGSFVDARGDTLRYSILTGECARNSPYALAPGETLRVWYFPRDTAGR